MFGLLQTNSKVRVSDSFNRPDGNVIGRADTGQLWPNSLDVSIKDNKLQFTDVSATRAMLMETSCINAIVRLNIYESSTGIRIILRRLANNDYFFTQQNISTIGLYSLIGGATTSLGSFPRSPTDGDIVECKLLDNNIGIFLNGNIIITHNDVIGIKGSTMGITGTATINSASISSFEVIEL